MGIKFPTPWKTLIIKFPPPLDGKGVKCPGYARGGGHVEASIWPIHKVVSPEEMWSILSWHHSKQISWLHFDPWVQERGTLRISPLSFTFSLKSREEETIYTSTLHRPSVNNINESTQLERTFLRAYFNVPLWLFGAFCPREWLKNFTFNTVELSKSAVSKIMFLKFRSSVSINHMFNSETYTLSVFTTNFLFH